MPPTATRIFLLLSAAVWLPYGLYCAASPESLATIAGVTATTTTGTIELRAMYGGLQAALGVLAALGATRTAFTQGALVTVGILCLGLGSTRLVAALLASDVSTYTASGLVFEWTSVLVAAACRRREHAR